MEATRGEPSRRKFLKSAGMYTVGLAASAGFLSGCAANGGSTKTAEHGTERGGSKEIEVTKWPWPYEKLNPELVRKKGYEGWYEGACSYGVVSAIISELRDKIGQPYPLLPIDMLRFGEGGVAGWSTLCGTLIGGGAVLTLIAGKEDYSKLVDELMGFYSETTLPTKKHEGYAKFPGQVQSVSGSPLCHVSVTRWCKVSGKKAFSPERNDRCAKLTGDVAAYVVELLNKHAEGTFVPTYTLPKEVQTCRGCHDKDGKVENTRGKMYCTQCHEPHQPKS